MRPIKELVQELKASYPRLEEAIPGLKRKSDIEYRGVCPSCEEERLGVFPKDQRFWCYGCECNGDIIEYYRIIGRGTMEQQIARMGEGNLGIPTGSATQISFTLFSKDKGILTKRMKLENGQLDKDASECRMSRGRAETVTLAPEQFGAFLQGLKQNQAIAHGICGHSKVEIVSKSRETGAKSRGGLPVIARTKEHFRYPEGPGLLMLDHDKARDNAVSLDAKALTAYSPDKLAEIISNFFPEIKQAAYVAACSTSSCIYSAETGEELRGKGAGFHLYLFPNNAADVPRFLAVLGKRLVLAGYGRVEISRAGSLLERTLADLLVGSPERLDFVAGAVCDKGLEQRRPEPEQHPGGLLDTAKLPDLSTEEEAAYQEIVRQLKEKAQPTQETIKAAYVEQEAEKLASSSGISLEQARETVKTRQGHILADADLLQFAHLKEPVSVAHALDNGPEFDGKACADPLEPEYNSSRSTAKFYWNEGRKPLVQSHAHGGIQYTFRRFAAAAEPEEKKTPEVWSFADVKEMLEHPELLKWMICTDQELDTIQRHGIAGEILLHNSFRPAELNAVRDMMKKQLGVAKGEQDKLLKVALKEQPKAKAEPDGDWFLVEERKGELKLAAQSRAAQIISEMTSGKFVYTSDTESWYRFTGTHWSKCIKKEFNNHLVESLTKGTGTVGFSAGYMDGVESIMVNSGLNIPVSELEREAVPFRNGILDTETGDFQPTTPENAMIWCLPYDYNPNASCDFFNAWLDEVCDDEKKGLQRMVRAVINVSLVPRPDLHFFVHLFGRPRTGKGTFTRLLQKIVGPDNFYVSDIELLENSVTGRFEAVNFGGKRILIFNEFPSHIKTSKFLALTGRDAMRCEEKRKQGGASLIYAGLVLMAGNSLFSTDDQTNYAIEERRRTLSFDAVMSAEDRKEFTDAGGERLLHEDIPGIINWALGMSREEVSEVFYNPPAKVVAANQAAEVVASPVVKFVSEHVRYNPAGKVYPGFKRPYKGDSGRDEFEGQEDKLYPRYLAWCLREDKKPLGRTRALDAVVDAVNRKMVPEGGESVGKGKEDKKGTPITGIELVPWGDVYN
jgi:putative DNA primase/helicase